MSLFSAAPMVSPFLLWLISVSLRGALVLGLAACLSIALRRRSAALRHAVWGAGLAAFLLVPIALGVVPGWRIAVPREAIVQFQRGPEVVAGSVVAATETFDPAPPLRPRPVGPPLAEVMARVIVAGWLTVAALLLLRQGLMHLGISSLVRHARPVTDLRWDTDLATASRSLGLDRPVRLLVSRELSMPVVAGWLAPSILLPAASAEWSADCRRGVLLHELAHVRRSDLQWLVLARLVSASFWFHPLVWLATAHLRAEAERACDDLVLASGERPSRYAAMLLAMASVPQARAPGASLAVLKRGGLGERIEAIITAGRNRLAVGPRVPASLAVVGCLLAGLVALPRWVPAAAPDGPHAAPRVSVRILSTPGAPVRVVKASVSMLRVENARPPEANQTIQVDSPEIEVENVSDGAIRAVLVRLETPGVSRDAVWREVAIAPHRRAWVRFPAGDWSNQAPLRSALKFTVAIRGVRFDDGRSWSSPEREPQFPQVPRSATGPKTPAPSMPSGSSESATPAPPPASTPRASVPPGAEESAWAPPAASTEAAEEPAEPDNGERVPAHFINPPGAPVQIAEAWTSRRPPRLSRAETEFHHGHALTRAPVVTLVNRGDRKVTSVRLRFKAEPASHGVTVVQQGIAPGQSLRHASPISMWGKPEAMTVQVLGVRFEDSSTWGTLDSTIDTRDGYLDVGGWSR
jgi:beta-lactamase regulating signal transducer with metallopeptidase domain